MLRRLHFACLLLFVSGIAPLRAQYRQHIFERIKGVHMQPTAYALDTDEHGRLWYGTWGRGAFVYDGYQFARYQSALPKENGLSNDRVLALLADKKQRVWISTMNGLDCLDRKTGEIAHFQAVGDSIFSFMALYEDNRGNIWAAGHKGVLRYDETQKSFVNVLPLRKAAAPARPNVFFEDASGTLWMGRADGLFRFTPARDRYEHFPVQHPFNTSSTFRVQAIAELKKGQFWLAGYDGLLQFSTADHRISRPELPDSLTYRRVSAMERDNTGRLWMAVPDKGLVLFSPADNRVQHFSHNRFDPNSLPSNNAFSLHFDRFHNLWVGTDQGLARLALSEQAFSRWQLDPENPESAANQTIRAAQDAHGGILVQTAGGMFYLPEMGANPVRLEGDKHHPRFFEPSAFFSDGSGKIWALYDGIYRWLAEERTFVKELAPLPNDRVFALCTDRDDSQIWWVGTLKGLYRYDRRAGEARKIEGIYPSHTTANIYRVVDDGLGNLWLAAPAALIFYEKKSGRHEIFNSKSPEPNTLPNDDIMDLNIGPDGTIWMATAGGITGIEPKGQRFRQWKGHLPDNLALNLVFDKQKTMWAVFPEHLIRAESGSGEAKSWNTVSMVHTGQMAPTQGIALRDGRLLFASRSGLILADPAQFSERIPPSAILLTRLQTSGTASRDFQNVAFLRNVQLSAGENSLTLEWSGIQTNLSAELRYECRLERKGEHRDWEPKGLSRQAVYANLDPGAYTFQVRIAGTETPELHLDLVIAPAWYQAESFKMLLMALLAAAAYLFWRNAEDRRELLQQKDLAEQTARYKTRFLANMSHEIRTPMNAILGLSRLLTESSLPPKQSEYADAIRQSSENLLVIVNDVLDQVKIESGKFKFQHKPFDLEVVLRNLRGTLGFKAAEKGLDFQIVIGENTPLHWVGDPVRLSQILTNLLGNAIKFTEKGSVSLSVSLAAPPSEKAAKRTLEFRVSDTGIGIAPEKLDNVFESFQQADDDISATYGGTGLGLSITKDLVEQQGGSIRIESTLGEGTAVTAHIPFEPDLRQEMEPSKIAAALPALKNLRILLVEDTFFNQMLATELLKSRIEGVTVELAENGRIAIEKVAANPHFDLVLMDLKMPVMDGLEATRRLRDMPESKVLPIIALTANAVQEELEKCKEVGMDAWVTKPIDAEELFATMHQVLHKKDRT